MASPVDICNTALSHIGAESEVTAIDPPDGSVEAGYCARFYPIARRMALEHFNWTFARTRKTLALVTNPSTVWKYAYALPADCLNPRRVLPLQTITAAGLALAYGSANNFDAPFYNWDVIDSLFNEQGSALFEVEGNVVLTNEPEAVLLYSKDVTDSSRFTPLFTTALAQLLAGYLAGPIVKGRDGMSIGSSWTQAGMNVLERAAASDANGTTETSEFMPAGLRVRS